MKEPMINDNILNNTEKTTEDIRRVSQISQKIRTRPSLFSRTLTSDKWRKNEKEDKSMELDPERGRNSKEKDHEGTELPNKKEMEPIPGEGLRWPVGGDVSGLGQMTSESARCLPTGDPNGCPPPPQNVQQTNNDSKSHLIPPNSTRKTDKQSAPRTIRLDRPKPFKADGKSYLRCSPMSTKVRLGSSKSIEEKGLVDPCSNTGIINKRTFDKYYPNEKINPVINEIKGVGRKKTIGWAIIPIFIDCIDEDDIECCVEFDIEVYVVEYFAVPLLIGLDALKDYGIELSTNFLAGSIPTEGNNLLFPLSCDSGRYQSVLVKSSERIVIPGRVAQAIKIKSPAMCQGINYIFSPSLTVPRSLPASPQLAHRILDSDTRYIMFTNFSEHPIELEKGQRLGEASPILFGSQYVDNLNLEIDWSDMTRPSNGQIAEFDPGTPPPETFSATLFDMSIQYEDMLSFDAFGQEKTRPPRSISEEDVIRIARNAPIRTMGDLFPTEDDEEKTPIPPMPDGEIYNGINLAASLSED